jgi:hypothetical protein
MSSSIESDPSTRTSILEAVTGMFTLPAVAKDEDLRSAVAQWFTLVASGEHSAAQGFLNIQNSADEMSVRDFILRVSELTSGGKVTNPKPIIGAVGPDGHLDLDALATGPIDLVVRWIPSPENKEKYPGVIGEIYHTVPVNGEWSRLEAAFFVRSDDGLLSLQLRDVCDDE